MELNVFFSHGVTSRLVHRDKAFALVTKHFDVKYNYQMQMQIMKLLTWSW